MKNPQSQGGFGFWVVLWLGIAVANLLSVALCCWILNEAHNERQAIYALTKRLPRIIEVKTTCKCCNCREMICTCERRLDRDWGTGK